MKKSSVGSRSAQAFFQGFLAALIVEACIVIIAIYQNSFSFDYTNIRMWVNLILPIIAVGVIAMIIAAIQNAAIESKAERLAEKKGGKK